MKIHTVYVCDKCGKESKDQSDIYLCEARHTGLTTVKEKIAYDSLVSYMKYCVARLSIVHNEMTNKVADDAIQAVLDFEKEHNMIVD